MMLFLMGLFIGVIFGFFIAAIMAASREIDHGNQ